MSPWKRFGGWLQALRELVILQSLQVSGRRKLETSLKLIFLLIVGGFWYYLRHVIGFPEDDWMVTTLQIIVFYLTINLVFHSIRIIIVSLYRKRNKFSQTYQDNFIMGTEKLANLLIYFVFAISLLFFFGVDIQSFFTTLGLFSVAIAWIFKEKISNLIDGIVIMFSDEVRLKDYLSFKGLVGRITEVNFLHTKMKTDDGDYVYIPNSNLLNAEFTNYSKSSVKRIRFDFKLHERYYGSIQELEHYLKEGLQEEFEDLIQGDTIVLKVENIREEGADVLLEMTVTRFNFSIDERIKRHASRLILGFINEKRDLPS